TWWNASRTPVTGAVSWSVSRTSAATGPTRPWPGCWRRSAPSSRSCPPPSAANWPDCSGSSPPRSTTSPADRRPAARAGARRSGAAALLRDAGRRPQVGRAHARAAGEGDGGQRGVDAQFAEDVLHVGADGVRGQVEALGDRLAAQARDHAPQDLPLARGEGLHQPFALGAVLAGRGQLAQHPG